MAYLVLNLIEGRGIPTCIGEDDTVRKALQLMQKHDFSQLPVLGANNLPIGMITYQSIIRGAKNFGLGINDLKVSTVIDKATIFSLEDSLFDILNSVMEENAVLIVDQERLIGIVTSFDSTDYFRKRAEDLMYVEDIEGVVKDFITSYYTNDIDEIDEEGLATAIQAISSDKKEANKLFRSAINRYLGEIGVDYDQGIFEEIFEEVYKPPPPKAFDELFLGQYIDLLLSKERWDYYGASFKMEPPAVLSLLDDIRNIRNILAHFKGELTLEQQDQLRFCADWIARCYNQLQVQIEEKMSADMVREAERILEELLAPDEEITGIGKGKYAPLAIWLQGQPGKVDRLKLTFEDVENIIETDLPSSAFTHREWWANDTVGHVQSRQWLDAGWRVAGKNMSTREVTFVRIKEREKAYIDFWSNFLPELKDKVDFKMKTPDPDGTNWVGLVSIPENGSQQALLGLTFALNQKFRIELYIDTGNKDTNKKIFDALLSNKDAIEKIVGAPLGWERMDNRRASRIALYQNGSITDNSEDLELLKAWIRNMLPPFYSALADKTSDLLQDISEKEI